MKYRILATFLSVVLLAGCVGEVSYAAPIDSVSVEAEQENVEDWTVSDGNEEMVLTGSGLAEDVPLLNEQEPVSVDISENLLQEGGLLAETVNEANDEDEVLVYQSIDEETYKAAEETLLNAYDSFATECDLSAYKILTSDIRAFVGDVLNTNPRYFFVNGGFQYYTDGTYATRIVIYYDYEQNVAEPMLEAFDEAVAVAVEGADESWSEMEKALYINDYLARNCEYDTTYAREFRYTAYGALVNKVAVCQGYALAYVVLADELGLNCEVVTSDSKNHAWNMVEINDKYYQVDATWNDPVNDRIGRARHIYFMKSTAHFQTTDGSYSTHYEEDDWEVTGGWDEAYANDTTYDTYFWNSVDMGFDYVGGEWYGFNGSAIARFDCDGVDFTQEEALKSITDTWYVWESTSSYWPKKYAGVGAFDSKYYYSTKTAIYQLDLNDYTSDLIYELTDTEKATGYIYGMHIAPTGEVYYILSTSPNEAGTVCHTITLEKNVSKYTICFDGNGATSGDMSSMSNCKYGSGYQLTANTYECAGYTFTGWNTEADGSGTAYEDGAKVKNLSETDGSTVTLYAQWKEKEYTISYQLGGGQNSANNPTSYTISRDTITLEDATKTGYTFVGWYVDENYVQQIQRITKGSTGSITLYAKWTPYNYNIAFDGNEATNGTMSTMSDREYGASYQLESNAYERAGYTFTGWNTKADGTGTAYADGAMVSNLSEEDGSTVTLYAQWSKETYSITYQLNGGENSDNNPITYDIDTATITLEDATKEDYVFAGWYSEQGYTKQITEIAKGSTGNITLYAKWNIKKYNIAFDGNEATSGTMSTMSDREYGVSYQLEANTYEREGYTFTGWNTKADGSGTSYADGATVSNLSEEDGSTVTLYAQWSKETYNITYQLNDGENSNNNPATYDIDTDTITLEDATRTGYSFGGWYSEEACTTRVTEITKGSTGNVTLYANWIPYKYNIAFDGNGSTSGFMSDKTDVEYGTEFSLSTNLYECAGYVFAGWNTEADGSGTTYADEASVSNLTTENGGTVTLYAQWEREKFTITYVLDGGENHIDNPADYTEYSETIILQDAVKEGHIFEGWYKDEAYKKQVTEIPQGSTESMILHAKWTAIKYHVAFDGNGADEGSMADLTDIEYRESYSLPANTFKRTGYEFIGWNTAPDGNGTSYADEAAILNLTGENGSTVTLFAQWRKLTYTVTYQLNGGQNSVANPGTYDITTQTIALQNPVRTGYTFEGWFTDAAYSVQITAISQGNVGNITLYAKWSANKYNIVFNKNKGSSGSMASLTVSYDENVKLAANKFKRTGYTFKGWNTQANGKGISYADKASVQNLTTENGGTVTLYAQWKKNSINKTKLTLYVGSSETLKLNGTQIKSVKTSSKKVATVTSKGKVTAKKAGKATITLKGKDGKSYKCTVTVKNPTINAKKKTLKVGKTFTLKLTGTTIKSASSSNKKVATVTSKGKVTAKSKGTATITLKGKDKKSYKCTITVK